MLYQANIVLLLKLLILLCIMVVLSTKIMKSKSGLRLSFSHVNTKQIELMEGRH